MIQLTYHTARLMGQIVWITEQTNSYMGHTFYYFSWCAQKASCWGNEVDKPSRLVDKANHLVGRENVLLLQCTNCLLQVIGQSIPFTSKLWLKKS